MAPRRQGRLPRRLVGPLRLPDCVRLQGPSARSRIEGNDHRRAQARQGDLSFDEMVARRDALTHLVGVDLWYAIEGVGADVAKDNYVVLNHNTVKDGQFAEWQKLETTYWKPLVEAWLKAGGKGSWSISSLRWPTGTSAPYSSLSVDVFADWNSLVRGVPLETLWPKVHPNITSAEVFETPREDPVGLRPGSLQGRRRGGGQEVDQPDLVAGADDAFHQDGAIDACGAAVVFGHAAHDLGVGQSGVGVERDHLAAGVAVRHRDLRLRADAQPAPHPLRSRRIPHPMPGRRTRWRGIAACPARRRVPRSVDARSEGRTARTGGSRSTHAPIGSPTARDRHARRDGAESSNRGSSTAKHFA